MTAREKVLSGALPRGIKTVELLAEAPLGLALGVIASELGIPKAAAHRALTDLMDAGFVRQDSDNRYFLTLRMLSLAFRHVQSIDVVSLARPAIEKLAKRSKELVRLSLVDGTRLVCVDKAQGSTSGLRYDDDLGAEANLFYTATAAAWLSQLTDAEALRLVKLQGVDSPNRRGPNAPRSKEEFIARLHKARRDGYCSVHETNEPGVSGVAAPVVSQDRVIGVVTIVGPHMRLTEERIRGDVPYLLETCRELGSLGLSLHRAFTVAG